jgi:hypothetical protein
MSDTDRSFLKIVPFSGTDYSLGEYLSEKHLQISETPVEVSNKLSLYFQWREFARSGLLLPNTPEPLACLISYDTDELVPTEIYLTLTSEPTALELSTLKRVKVRFEVFRTCYEFTAEVLACRDSLDDTGPHLVLSVPEKLTTFRQRRLPRIRLSEEDEIRLPLARYATACGPANVQIPISIRELGLRSCVISTEHELPTGVGTMAFGDLVIPCEIVRKQNSSYIVRFNFEDPIAYGAFFDIYRVLAFPNLAPRNQVDPADLLQLYASTGYLKDFIGPNVDPKVDTSLAATWTKLNSDQHTANVDYVVLDEKGSLCGASSLTQCFQTEQTQYWVFHQLCSVTSPNLLECSGQLYFWRAEYLAGRPESFSAMVWFRSDSRWLERIYVKFSKYSTGGTVLKPVKLMRGTVTQSSEQCTDKDGAMSSYKFGGLNRTVTNSTGYVGGVGPDLLNASALLNGVASIDADLPPEKYDQIAKSLLLENNSNEAVFYFTTPFTSTAIFDGFVKTPSDRLCIIPKEDLVAFLSSVEHSVAVTRRKMNA